MKKSSAVALGIVLFTAVAASALTTIRPFRASGGVQMVSTPSWNGPDGGGGIYYKADQGLAFHSINGVDTVLGSGGGGSVTWPLTNGTSTNTLKYAGTMTGSSIAESHDTTNAYTTGDVAYQNKSAGTVDWFIGYPASATIPEFRSTTVNLGFRNSNGDGAVMQSANHLYLYIAGTPLVDISGGVDPYTASTSHVGTVVNPWGYAAANWYATPAGASLTSASTITPTQAFHSVTGTTTISTIATTNLPASFNGQLTLLCTASCAFTTGGNIAVAFTGVAGNSYILNWDGTSWKPVGPAAAGTLISGTLTSGIFPVATGSRTVANSNLSISTGTLDLVAAGVMTLGGANTSGLSFPVSISSAPRAVAGASSTTISATGSPVVSLNLVSATTVSSLTVSAGSDGQELEIHVVQPASGTPPSVPTTWTNVSFNGGTYTNTTVVGKRDILQLRYFAATSKWYERTTRVLSMTN